MAKVSGIPSSDHENILLENYRVKTVSSSSCMKGSSARNILCEKDSKMWLSEPGLP